MTRTQTLPSSHIAASRRIPAAARAFLSLLERLQHGHLRLHTPDGRWLEFGSAGADRLCAQLHLHDWRACGPILSAGDIGLAQAWRDGQIDSPDPTALLRLAIRNDAVLQQALFGTWLARGWFWLRHRLRPNSRTGSRRNIHAHYDLGNAFYRLWLDESMTYSAACFDGDHNRPLAQAQAAKYQRIIDLLDLQPGQRVLEIGCGWGGFAHHAARQGIAVHGVTISPAQLQWAQQRLHADGLDDLARLELCDYRELQGQYDAMVSIEMFEAVGQAYWPGYFQSLRQRLRPGGKAVVQSITIDERHFARYRDSSDFIREFIFPGGMLPSPQRLVQAAQSQGLQHLHTHAFGGDYAETLRRWRAAFVQQRDAIAAQGFDEAFLRLWLLYLCYCEAGFDEGRTDVCHFVLQA